MHTMNTRIDRPLHPVAPRPRPGRILLPLFTRLLKLLALAGLLWGAAPMNGRAQATVYRGEIAPLFIIPFAEVPDDPEVRVLAHVVVTGQMIMTPSGAEHLMAGDVSEVIWSRVSGSNFRYELKDIEMEIRDGHNGKGHFSAGASLRLTLLRIDRATSQPVAVLTGEGRIQLNVNLRNDQESRVENMTWTVSPLP